MFNRAKYSLELRQLAESKNFKIFDFNYEFYEPMLKCKFEQKFIDHYYFNEIGFETIARFKQRLKSKLNLRMPYYKQLYETELAAKDINFLLNKDLKETFIRELDKMDNITGSNTQASQDSSNVKGTATSDNQNQTTNIVDGKVSNVADGVASAELASGYLTGASEENTRGTDRTTFSGNNSSTTQNTGSLSGSNKEDRTGKETEKTEMLSQGNIGITSSAELLEKWRNVLINIDQMIIEECQDLFMGIY